MDEIGQLCAGAIIVWVIFTYFRSVGNSGDNDKDWWENGGDGVGEI